VSVSDGSGNLVSFEKRGLSSVVRASVHYFNTEQEIDYFSQTLQQVL
jgi:selenocysteine lyase/cysteine desulfurase